VTGKISVLSTIILRTEPSSTPVDHCESEEYGVECAAALYHEGATSERFTKGAGELGRG
jgi:hypothetical protein